MNLNADLRLGMWPRPFGTGGGGVATSSLLTGLVSAWELEDETDSHGANDLTNNNGVTFVPVGPSGVVADFDNTASEALTSADNASLSLGSDSAFMIGGWFKLDAYLGGANDPIAKWGGAGNLENIEYALRALSATALDFVVGNGTTSVVVTGVYTVGLEVFVLAWHDPAADKVFIQINNGTPVEAAWSGGTQDGDGVLAFGRAGSFASQFINGKTGRWGFWKGGFLGSTERTSLFNGGKGKLYSELTAAEKVNLVSYWNMNEASGNRADSHGSNTLTDTNTVGSVTNSYPANMPGLVANFAAASNQYLSRTTTLGLTTQASISVWVNPNNIGTTGNGALLAHWDGTDNWILYSLNSGELLVYGQSATSNFTTTDAAMVNGQWYNIIVAYDGSLAAASRVKIYRNGTLLTTTPTGTYPATWNDASLPFEIGRPGGAINLYNGQESSAYIASRVWTSTERDTLYNSGAGGFYPFTGLP